MQQMNFRAMRSSSIVISMLLQAPPERTSYGRECAFELERRTPGTDEIPSVD